MSIETVFGSLTKDGFLVLRFSLAKIPAYPGEDSPVPYICAKRTE